MMEGSTKKRLPVGYEDFKQIIDNDRYYVDKTMLIYELLCGDAQNTIITRPRRFGKTLNFSMLRYFFDITEKENAYLFDTLNISKHYAEIERYRNAYPVISISLKCGKQGSYEAAVDSICVEIQDQFVKYDFIADSGRLKATDNNKFKMLLETLEYSDKLFKGSIKLLSTCLKQYYGSNVVILIDEYDVPLEDAYFSGYYDDMVRFIRSLFESALKTNAALEFSVITGCLRISKESIFTGLNNLKVQSILSPNYSEYFGFLESEVMEMFKYYGFDDKFDTAKCWYDGYLFGTTEVYNPWSIINYVSDLRKDPNAQPEASWANSSSNNIIRRLVEQSNNDTKEIVERLVNGGSVDTSINETTTYGDLNNGNENIWSFLLFTGYLTPNKLISSGVLTGDDNIYSLVIPNLEIKNCYKSIIKQYFDICKQQIKKDDLYKALLARDAAGFAKQITELLRKSISYYDNAEQFYHGLITGLLSGDIYYRVVSNREAGCGRSDLMIYQESASQNAIILELKVCRGTEKPDEAAQRALRQIDERDYAAEAQAQGYKNIIKYGIAFKGKLCYAVVGD